MASTWAFPSFHVALWLHAVSCTNARDTLNFFASSTKKTKDHTKQMSCCEHGDLDTYSLFTSELDSHSDLELIDPHPDIRALFVQFDKEYFGSVLGGVEVSWSSRLTLYVYKSFYWE